MSKRTINSSVIRPVVLTVDPTECPFREFRDNELQIEFWGMGPSAFRTHSIFAKTSGTPKPPADYIWADDQTQPLPRSVRQYLHGYVRAEELAMSRWEAEVVVFEENNGGKMSLADIQLSHAQVLTRSSFCRNVLSACFLLERTENFIIEHQWEGFSCVLGPDGWRAKYHIYTPGTKPGGGVQHRPQLSKSGCYLVRLYYLGAWRCVWVSDQVPIDATEAPLLPFSPLLSRAPPGKPGVKQAPATVTSSVVFLWPLLICKALLKLAAPDMNSHGDPDYVEDELMPEFDIMHALTGGLNMRYQIKDEQLLWELITSEVPMFVWDDDDETASTVKSKSTKKLTTKDTANVRRATMVFIILNETRDLPPYHLPGITPGFEMSLLISMARDLPLKKPLPEPELALWKYYRWVDWARRHGLMEAYDCPRTRFVKVNGLLKLSFAPHLLDVQSTESITVGFIKAEQTTTAGPTKDKGKAKESKSASAAVANLALQQIKEELREWIQYLPVHELIKYTYVLYYPSMFVYTTAASCPPVRVTKALPSKHLDIVAPKSAPLYLQIDGIETNILRISLNMLHPRVLGNSGVLIMDYIESAYLILECFEWFDDCELPQPKAYVRTCGYDAVEARFLPGRHFCRIWVHSRMNWHMMLLSESSLLLGPRDQILCAAVRECPWASKFLMHLGNGFINWIKVNRANPFLPSVLAADKEFFKCYRPDLAWDEEVVGYPRNLLHWMFRQALQAHLLKRLAPSDIRNVCMVMRKYLCDPDFCLPNKRPPPPSLRAIVEKDPCDCVMPELEEFEIEEEQTEDSPDIGEKMSSIKRIVQSSISCSSTNEPSWLHGHLESELLSHEVQYHDEEKNIMDKLLTPPVPPITSNVCEMATKDVPCAVLKEKRNETIRTHEAATTIQAHWRGTWARRCLKSDVTVTPDVLRVLQEAVFGSQEALSCLMNEFFALYPGAKYAYSVASALSGVYGLQQHTGASSVTLKCKWIPYFQGVFNCHSSCKVHFDVNSSIHHSTVAVYNNDIKEQLPQAYNAHTTFDFHPNVHGYTVIGHGSLNEVSGANFEVHWQLTVLSSIDGAFHICDNDDICREIPLTPASKLHIDEIFIPNRRNILGGIQLSVTKHEPVSFRAAATLPDLEIEVKLRTMSPTGTIEELSSCSGVGEIFWPYIPLEPAPPKEIFSQANIRQTGPNLSAYSARSLKAAKSKPLSGRHTKSSVKMKTLTSVPEPKQYWIEVTAPSGWPLTVAQWRRVDEVRNSLEHKHTNSVKKVGKEKTVTVKPGSTKDKTEKQSSIFHTHPPQAGDAFVELECSLAIGGGVTARRDDDREVEFSNATKAWDEMDPGRNQRGAEIRKIFREEYLEVPPPPPSESLNDTIDLTIFDAEAEHMEEDTKKLGLPGHGPTPVTESEIAEMSAEAEEEVLYFTMPEQLRDKFIPLDYVPLCTKELVEDGWVVMTSDMIEAGKQYRHATIDAAIARMHELQIYNDIHVLGRQRNRCHIMEKLFVDGVWSPELQEVLEQRDEAIVQETNARILSASKKKQDSKVKK